LGFLNGSGTPQPPLPTPLTGIYIYYTYFMPMLFVSKILMPRYRRRRMACQ